MPLSIILILGENINKREKREGKKLFEKPFLFNFVLNIIY